MKAIEFREMSRDQLVLTLKDLQDGLFRLRFQSQTEKLEAPSEMRKAKRDIARAKTILRERDLTAGAQASSAPATGVTQMAAPTGANSAEEQHE